MNRRQKMWHKFPRRTYIRISNEDAALNNSAVVLFPPFLDVYRPWLRLSDIGAVVVVGRISFKPKIHPFSSLDFFLLFFFEEKNIHIFSIESRENSSKIFTIKVLFADNAAAFACSADRAYGYIICTYICFQYCISAYDLIHFSGSKVSKATNGASSCRSTAFFSPSPFQQTNQWAYILLSGYHLTI